MHTKTSSRPVWLITGVTTGPCPLQSGLLCDIPITRTQVTADGKPCHEDNRCRGQNHPDPLISRQAQDELDWHISH